MLKFFPLKSFEMKNDFATKHINFTELTGDECNKLPDHVIAKIEKIGFDRSNLKTLQMDDFLEQVFGKDSN